MKPPPPVSPEPTTLGGGGGPKRTTLWEIGEDGFLPRRPPVARPAGPELAVLSELCVELPFRIAERRVADLIKENAARLERAAAAIRRTFAEDDLECSHASYAYLVCGLGAETRTVPRCVASGFVECSRKLGRKPMLDYADCVLYNWEMIDPHAGFTPSNLRLLRRFTGLIDEEWFFKSHLIVESAAAGVVAGVRLGAEAIERSDWHGLAANLATIEECFGRVARDALPVMFERNESMGQLCDYSIFFNALRPLMAGGDFVFQGQYDDVAQHLPGPSGAMSTLLPALDAFFGVENSSRKLDDLLRTFSKSMPRPHREFLRSLRERGASARAAAVAHPEVLADRFDRCVDLILDFRWKHLHMVKKYLVEKLGRGVVGTGGTDALDYLHQHIADTEATRLRVPPVRSWDGPSLSGRFSFFTNNKKTASEEQQEERSSRVWNVETAGFCPASVAPPAEDDVLTKLTRSVPAFTPSAFRRLCDAVAWDDITLADAEAALETQRAQLAFVSAAYARRETGDASLPPALSALLEDASKRVDRAKKLSFTDVVTYNAHGTLLGRFLAVPEEEKLYRRLHRASLATPALVAAILDAEAAAAARDAEALCASLDRVRAAIRNLSERDDDDDDDSRKAIMRRLRHFLVPAGAADSDLAAFLYCGADASALLVTLWRFLGVPKAASPASPLQFARDSLATGRASPPQHRRFALERHPDKIRAAVQAAAKTLPVHELARLDAAYNGCLDHLHAFCLERARLVCSYLPDFAERFMLKDFQPDSKAIHHARLNLVFDRRRSHKPADRPRTLHLSGHAQAAPPPPPLQPTRPKARHCPLLAPPPPEDAAASSSAGTSSSGSSSAAGASRRRRVAEPTPAQ